MPQAPARRAASESSDVAKLVGLHHRRRGWAWVAAGSAIGLAVYAGIDVNLFESLTGTAEILSVITVFVLLALVLAGLVVVIVDTARIHRTGAAVRVSAKGNVSHYPLYAHAHRYPPHHRGSWVFVIVMLVALTSLTVFILPARQALTIAPEGPDRSMTRPGGPVLPGGSTLSRPVTSARCRRSLI
jgi:hypothetical protein